ncbi:hypothetical protein AOLI_G00060880 [Acnodon oligacanthus]
MTTRTSALPPTWSICIDRTPIKKLLRERWRLLAGERGEGPEFGAVRWHSELEWGVMGNGVVPQQMAAKA